ncbi:hypothetical protein QJS04_geneDACA004401 [Acorus gramineus]|uniref:RIN4 pathogenic type III effector avirulence factor Avr cleavage site domain-containing protein n=1 Tax=Acorus gramineus TaxID=55184 RepID=A0AAV9B5B0_ACOGR|nr:hypothetical protein QJS04_geneDACA004401 [Acorus gramineus]
MRFRVPAFGNWDLTEDQPITQYFDSAAHAGLNRGPFFFADVVEGGYTSEDLKKQSIKVKKGEQSFRSEKRKQGGVCVVEAAEPQRRHRAPKPVDEDLYKVPPELLSRKPRKRMDFWSSCLRVNCVM